MNKLNIVHRLVAKNEMYFGRMLENLSTDEFKDKTTFSLIAEEKFMQVQIKRKEKNRDEKA